MTAIRKSYIDSIHGQLHVRIARPDGPVCRPPLFCLHQSPRSGWEWEPIMGPLAADRVVIAPDTPGYGASDLAVPIGIEDYAQVMARLIEDLAADGTIEPGPVDLIGYHTGSIIATALADRHAPLVRRAVLIGLAGYDEAARAAKMERMAIFPTPERSDLSHVDQLWTLSESMTDPRASPQWRHAALAEGLRSGVRLPWGFGAVYRYDFQGAMARVAQPVLVVDLADDLRPITAANAARFSDATLVPIDAAHGVLELETERVVTIVRSFLDG